MKKILFILILMAIFFTSVKAQTPGGCAMVASPANLIVHDSGWRTQSIPQSCGDFFNFIQSNKTLTFNVNFHFFRPTPTSPHYQTAKDYYQYVTAADCDTLIKYVNQRMANFRVPPDIASTPPSSNNYNGSIIQYNLVKDPLFHIPHVFFHTNDTAWLPGYGLGAWAYHRYAVNPNSEINIFFTADSTVLTGGQGLYGYVMMSSFPWTPTQFCPTCPQQTFTGTMTHELGHSAGCLGHTDIASSWGSAFSSILIPSKNFFPTGGTTDYYDEPSSGPCWGNVPSVHQGGCGSNNIMGYNNDRTYLSPNQIGAFFYSVYAGINAKFVTNPGFPTDRCAYDSSQTLNITHDTTWNSAVVCNGDVVIQPGVTLTIHCTAAFANGSRVIVKPTGVLAIDGGTLTSMCGFWQGVQVWGNSSQNQYINFFSGRPYYQGLVSMANGAVISNAQVAITAIAKYNNGSQDWSKTGGLIWASVSNFTGNIKDIEFMYYQTAPSSSFIADCSLNGNNQPSGGWPDARISLYGINGVQIKGNYMYSNANLVDNGITSADASFIVDSLSGGQKGYFNKCKYGIYAQNSTLFNASTINGATFYLSFNGGIYMSHGNYSTITNNIFQVKNATSTLTNPDYGIYMDNSTGYSIRGNQFYGNTGTWATHAHSGIYINNSGTPNNSCYNNYFKDLNYGLTAQEQNQGTGGASGLIMNCHRFVNCKYNISVTGTSPSTGVLHTQGSLTNQNLYVRNTYAAPSCGSQNLYSIGSNQGFQLYHPSFTGSTYQPTPQQSCSDSTKIRVYQLTGTYNYSTQCPGNCTGCRTIGEIQRNIHTYEGQLTALRSSGSTEQRQRVQDELNFEKSQLGLLSNDRIRNFLNDTSLQNPMDSVIAELKLKRNPDYKRQLIGAYLSKGNVAVAQNYLDSVRADEPLNTDLYEINTELINRESNPIGYIENLRSNLALKNRLLSMANNRASAGCTQAQVLLGQAFGMKFQEPIQFPEAINGNRFNDINELEDDFGVFPNPASTNLNVYFISNKDQTTQLTICDLSGRVVQAVTLKADTDTHEIDISELTNGVYFVSLLKGNQQKGTKKVIVIK